MSQSSWIRDPGNSCVGGKVWQLTSHSVLSQGVLLESQAWKTNDALARTVLWQLSITVVNTLSTLCNNSSLAAASDLCPCRHWKHLATVLPCVQLRFWQSSQPNTQPVWRCMQAKVAWTLVNVTWSFSLCWRKLDAAPLHTHTHFHHKYGL